MSARSSLKQSSQNPWSRREHIDSFVIEIQDDDEQRIDKVEREENAEKDPSDSTGEEQSVAAPRVVK